MCEYKNIIHFTKTFIKFQDETKREKQFYLSRDLPLPKTNALNIFKKNQNIDTNCFNNKAQEIVPNNFHFEGEQIALELVSFDQRQLKQIKCQFVKCSAKATVTHLKKLILAQLNESLEKHKMVLDLSF